MHRTHRWTRILLASGLLVSAAAIWKDFISPCDACSVGGAWPVALVGTCAYGALLLASLFGAHALVFCGVAAAVAIHGALVGLLMSSGASCLLCFTALGNALALFALGVAADPDNHLRAAFIIPLTAVVVAGGLTFLPQVPQGLLPPDRAIVTKEAIQVQTGQSKPHLIVFEKPDCPYCWEVKDRLIPRLQAELGQDSFDIQYRDASEMPGLRYTPTLVIGRAGCDPIVIEGLPAYETLLAAFKGDFQ